MALRICWILGLLAPLTSLAQGGPAATDRRAVVASVSGTLLCRVVKTNKACGNETFTLTKQSDATRTLRVHSEMPDRGMQIDIVLRVDQNFRPLEGYTQTYASGKLLGSGFFAVRGLQLNAAVQTPERFVAEVLEVPENFSLLLHPVAADGWHFGYYDKTKGGTQTGVRCTVGAAMESVRCKLTPVQLTFVADETIKVPAGKFRTEHFRFGESTDVWVTGPDRIMVRHEYRTFGTRFELSKLVDTG
jgi:hypothetical protein